MIQQKIIDIAKSFIGMQEVPSNMGFKDGRFEELMEGTGWQKGQAWCAYFSELVWKMAYTDCPPTVKRLDALFAAGAVKTFSNFKGSEFIVDKHPEVGSVVIWQQWKESGPTWMGHAGIVISITNDNQFITVEGNTNSSGGREGIEVAERERRLNFDARNGLVLKGFIHAL